VAQTGFPNAGFRSRLMPSFVRLATCVLVVMLVACSTSRLDAPPADQTSKLQILGISNARFWIDEGLNPIMGEMKLSLAREQAAAPPGASGMKSAPVQFLALSGGADNGAFGAGLLVGWTASGQRPEFKLVTGISTGSLIAPFAFLGPSYDNQLRAVFTEVSQKDIFRNRFFTAAITDDAMANTAPLFSLISKYANQQMLDDIAREYAKGRLLFIGSTNIDVQRPVIWNIGAIAASKQPGALDLFRKILLASSAIPGAFPPVLIDVDVDGQHHQEMHVDGGAIAQTFLYPVGIKLQEASLKAGIKRERTAYIIRNGRLDPDWANTHREFLSIAGRAIATMIHYSGVNDITRIYFTTQRDGVNFRLAYIGKDFPDEQHEQFDPKYMQSLFDYGYQKARNGYPWLNAPPGFGGPAVPAVAATPVASATRVQ
jgi:predicted patatin/cPLA2 family phospholipase